MFLRHCPSLHPQKGVDKRRKVEEKGSKGQGPKVQGPKRQGPKGQVSRARVLRARVPRTRGPAHVYRIQAPHSQTRGAA